MTRKSSKHLCGTYGITGQLFWPYEVLLAVCTVISPTEDQTSDHRMQSQNSTTDPSVYIAHKRYQINK